MGGKQNGLDAVYSALLARRESEGRLRRLTLPTKNAIDFSSNGYLSLSANPQIKRAYIAKLQASGVDFGLGSGGSRLLDGNSVIAETLESSVAAFHRAPAALLFTSGFEANTGLFGCAPQPGDVVIYDELIHASVHDGIKLSRAKKLAFSHNCVYDSTDGGSRKSLDQLLRDLLQNDVEIRTGTRNVFVAVEGIYSMDGDIAPLKDVIDCVEQRLPRGNGHIIVDEAHSTGVLGERGRGLVCELGLEDRVWARVHTFGKAMGCTGAMVLCSPVTRSYLINYARSLIYTTSMSYPMLMAIQTAYEYLGSGLADPLRGNLYALMRYTHELLSSMCARRQPSPDVFRIHSEKPESPIIPLFTSQARSLATRCQQMGFLVRPIVAPTVPHGTDRVRLCLHGANTFEQVDGLCKVIEDWVGEQLGQRASGTTDQPPTKQTLLAMNSTNVDKSRL